MILFNYFFLAKSCPLPEPESPQAIGEFVKSKRQEVSKQNRSLTLQVFLWALDWVRGQLVDDKPRGLGRVCARARACAYVCIHLLTQEAWTALGQEGRHIPSQNWLPADSGLPVLGGHREDSKTFYPELPRHIMVSSCLPVEGAPLLPLPAYLPWPFP